MIRQLAHLTDAGVLMMVNGAMRRALHAAATGDPGAHAALAEAQQEVKRAVLQLIHNGNSPADARLMVQATIKVCGIEWRAARTAQQTTTEGGNP